MYFITIHGRTIGPMTAQQVISYPVNENTPVCTDDGVWNPLFTYPELQELLTSRRTSPDPYQQFASQTKDKTAAGLLAIFLGILGIQYFYLGKTTAGIICLLLTLCSCGAWEIITFIQGILMLTMSQEEFESKFVYTDKTFPIF